MAATYVTVTNLTATTVTVAGDEGKPVVKLGHAAGANTATINMVDLLGNHDLCSALSAWITDSTVSITRGSVTLLAADLDAYEQGSDMNRSDYDSDDDGVVDASESIDFSAVTATTATAIGDSFLIYDLSETETRKVTVPVAFDISVLTACADATASDDSVLIYDTSVGSAPKARKTPVSDLLNPLKLTNAAAVASGDFVILHDLTAPTIASKTTVEALLNPVNLTAAAAVAKDDSIAIQDLSAAATIASKTSVQALLNPLCLDNAAAVALGDFVILHDLTAPTIASKTTVEALLNPVNLTAAAAVDKADSVIIQDLSAAATIASKTSVEALLNPANLTAETVVADADTVLICSAAAPTIAKKMTVANLLARKVFEHTDLQAVAIDLTSVAFIAPAAGTIKGCLCKPGVGEPATGTQTMTVDVKIGAVSVLTAPMLMDAASASAVVTGVLGAGVTFAAGDVITVIRDYTVGGGGTLANTVVSVWANIAL